MGEPLTSLVAEVEDVRIEQDHETGLCHILDGEGTIRFSLEYWQLERLATEILRPLGW